MVERDAVRRGYDELAEAYAASRSGGGTEELATFLHGLSGGSSSDPPRVLDAGCGQGAPVLARLSASTDAVGLDFSREMLSLAETNAPGAALVQGDMTALPFADGAFDAVVACWSLIHVPADAHRTVVGEFARVLGPGGRLLVTEGAEAWTGENPDWLDAGVGMQWSIAGAAATREQLRDAGFSVVREWGATETLGEGSTDGDDPWVFFSARLDG